MEETREQTSTPIRCLLETERRLMELTRAEVDSILDLGGRSYLLQGGREKLRQSEERFRCGSNAAATGIATFTPEGHYLRVNAAYCRMLGYPEDELSTLDFSSLAHFDDLKLNLKFRDELRAAQREVLVMEKRYFNKNRDVPWARSMAAIARPEYSSLDRSARKDTADHGISGSEKEFIRKDGSRVPILIAAVFRGNTDAGVPVVLDFTEHHKLERKKWKVAARWLAASRTISTIFLGPFWATLCERKGTSI